MKRNLLLLKLMIITIFLFWETTVFAYPDGILDGKTMNVGSNQNTIQETTNLVTDGDESTAYSIGSGQYKTVWYEFPYTVNVLSYQLKADTSSFRLVFYASNGTELASLSSSNLKIGQKTPYNINNVKKVAIQKTIYNAAQIYEFDIWIDVPDAPTGLNAIAGDGQVALSWNAVNYSNLAGYHVYQDGVRITTMPITSTTYTVTGLENGRSYTFQVTSVDKSGIESAKSAPVTVTPIAPDTTPPAIPTGLTGTAGDGSVTLTWNAVKDSDLEGYLIFVDGVQITVSPIKSTIYTVTGLENGRAYEFRVSAVDKSGNFSNQSDPITLTPYKKPNPPDNVRTSPGSDQNGKYLLITWDEVPNAVSYKIYIDGKFVAQVPAGTTQYKAYGYDPNREHRVEVTTISPDGQESKPGKAPSMWEKVTLGFTPMDLLYATFQFIMIFSNLILLVLASIFAPRIYRFLKHLAKEKGVKF